MFFLAIFLISDALQNNITPRFEFGFGLSYTSFHYKYLTISKMRNFEEVQRDEIENWEAGNSTTIKAGSSTSLWYAPL